MLLVNIDVLSSEGAERGHSEKKKPRRYCFKLIARIDDPIETHHHQAHQLHLGQKRYFFRD